MVLWLIEVLNAHFFLDTDNYTKNVNIVLPLKKEIKRFLYGPWQRTFPHCYWLAELLALGHLLFQLVISAFDFSCIQLHCLGTTLRRGCPPFFAILYQRQSSRKSPQPLCCVLIPTLRLQRMLGQTFAAIFWQKTEFVTFFPPQNTPYFSCWKQPELEFRFGSLLK